MTITTVMLDPDTGDLADVDGRQVILEGIEAIKQTCLSRLRTFLGEVFTDTTKGVPWKQQILALKGVSTTDVGGILRREILECPDIVSCGVVSVTLDNAARSVSVSFHAKASTGEDVVVEDEELV
jgi:hypothetical protein